MNNTPIEYDYRQYMFDDYDSEGEGEGEGEGNGGCLDTQWIQEYETRFVEDEYRLFLKTDITRVTFEFFYLDHDKRHLERIVPMTYSLKTNNQISHNEIFSIVRSHQNVDKKYYNFQSLLLYSFDFKDNCNDIVRALSNYIRESDTTATATGTGSSAFIEYTNLLSIDVISFSPLVTMFHDFIGFSVLLYED
jgi:hypothetical protein